MFNLIYIFVYFSEVDSILKCIRSHINMCEAAKDYLLLKLQIPAIDDNILDNCPGINFTVLLCVIV